LAKRPWRMSMMVFFFPVGSGVRSPHMIQK
jgi:hypothetical protein